MREECAEEKRNSGVLLNPPARKMRELADHLPDLPLDAGLIGVAFGIEDVGRGAEAEQRRGHERTDLAERITQMAQGEDRGVLAVADPADPPDRVLEGVRLGAADPGEGVD